MERETAEYLVEDILSQETKDTRKQLLIALFISLAIVKGGLLPKSIDALGISLDVSNIKSITWLLLILCTYLLLSFIQLSISNFISWKMRFYTAIALEFKTRGEIGSEVDGRPNVPGHNDKIDKFMRIVAVNNIVRVAFEIIVPIIFAVASLILILIYITQLK